MPTPRHGQSITLLFSSREVVARQKGSAEMTGITETKPVQLAAIQSVHDCFAELVQALLAVNPPAYPLIKPIAEIAQEFSKGYGHPNPLHLQNTNIRPIPRETSNPEDPLLRDFSLWFKPSTGILPP